jgi:hypothetical protein
MLAGVAVEQSALFPLAVAFLGSMAALHVLRQLDREPQIAPEPAVPAASTTSQRQQVLLS